VRGSDQVPANLSTLKCGLGQSWRPGSDNVRYLRQFGEHILGSSFTALDPKETAAALVHSEFYRPYPGAVIPVGGTSSRMGGNWTFAILGLLRIRS
jgi:hypothetical protein